MNTTQPATLRDRVAESLRTQRAGRELEQLGNH
jgi:hypothetical protein